MGDLGNHNRRLNFPALGPGNRTEDFVEDFRHRDGYVVVEPLDQPGEDVASYHGLRLLADLEPFAHLTERDTGPDVFTREVVFAEGHELVRDPGKVTGNLFSSLFLGFVWEEVRHRLFNRGGPGAKSLYCLDVGTG